MTPPHLAGAVALGRALYLSGQIAFDDEGRVAGDVSQQTQRCLDRLEAVLATHDLDREAIVKTTVWLTRRDDFAAFNTAYAAFFGTHKPARSTVIAGLAIEGAVIEIEAVAERNA